MKKNLKGLADSEFDLVVIGGGIFGACAAWDAVQRGLNVALLEKGDFSQEASAHNMKMIHGGIRYLQRTDFAALRQSCRERSAMLRIAPHLVYPMPITIPVYGMKEKFSLGAGAAVYDLLTMNRNRSISDEGRRIPNKKLISRNEVIERLPGVNKNGLTGAAVFYDTQVYSPPRLALSFIRAAAEAGAEVSNYVEATGFLKKENRVEGVKAKCNLSGETFDVRAKVVLNATGAWAEKVLENGAGLRFENKPVFSRSVCFAVPRRPKEKFALACHIRSKDADAVWSSGERYLFMTPWRDCTLVGVWCGAFDGLPEDVTVTPSETEKYLKEANKAYPGLGLCADDVSVVNTGLMLFAENRQETEKVNFGHRSILLDHEEEHKISGLITLIGMWAANARSMGEQAVNLVFRKLGMTDPRSNTETTPVFGGRILHFGKLMKQVKARQPQGLKDGTIEQMIHNYGSEYQRVLKYAEERPEFAARLGGTMVIGGEVVHAIREEMAETLTDIVFRRTDLGTACYPGLPALSECARIMAKEAGWSEERTGTELEEVRKHFTRHGVRV